MATAIITQARMTSTRLPGKVLLEAGGKSMLAHHVDRLRDTGLPIIVATTTNKSDDPIVDEAARLSVEVYRGSENDVLSRYIEAATHFGIDTVIRVTSDCPLIDSSLILDGLQAFRVASNSNAYVSNTLERTYPRGFDFEIVSTARLVEARHHATRQAQTEHVTPWIYEEPSTELIQLKQEVDSSQFRLTLDTPDDLKLLQTLINDHHVADLNYESIIEILTSNPSLALINTHVPQKPLN